MLVIDTRIKLLLFILINFMVFGLKDFILGSVCFFFICILSCLMGQKKIVLKYLIFYVVIAAIQQLCAFLPQAIETILSIFTLFIRVMIPVVLFASTFIATTKVSELIAAMYSLKIPRSITITFAMVLRFFPTFSEEIHNIYDAMKLRGIALSWKNVFTRPVLILEAIAIPIVMRSASIAEELSASAVTRGIDNPAQRTSFMEPESLMSYMSFVFQDVTLFNDTVMNNIRLGNPNATDDQVIAAAKAAYCDEFVREMPDGYQTVLGENGSTLSGGERQRISIARALLKNAPIILLDEATASLDPENEVLVQKAIAKLVEGKTVIMIAHRLRTVVDADQILVLDNGRLVEHGTHDELMKKNGLYHKLFHIQQESLGWAV